MPRRTSMGWGIRGGLVLLVAALTYLTVSHSMAQNMRRRDPAAAYALASYDGRFGGALAQRLSGEGLDDAARNQRVVSLAQRALRQDPTAVSAVVSLGVAKLQYGDVAGARRLLRYAERLSRRDLPTQLWAIEDAVSRNDVAGALQHYDIALRTSVRAGDVLFPVLASAIANADIRAGLVTTLRGKPPWTAAFIGYVAGSKADPLTVSRLFIDMQLTGLSISPDATATVINRLIAAGAMDDAWRHYASARHGAARQASRDPKFAGRFSTPAVFDWNPVNDTAIMTSLEGNAPDGGFHFAVSPGASGMVLQQLQLLPPGTYRLDGKGSGIEQPQSSLPYWTLTCNDGRETGRIVVSASTRINGRFTGTFTVPADCPVQTLKLVVRSSDSIAEASGKIDWVRLVAVQ